MIAVVIDGMTVSQFSGLLRSQGFKTVHSGKESQMYFNEPIKFRVEFNQQYGALIYWDSLGDRVVNQVSMYCNLDIREKASLEKIASRVTGSFVPNKLGLQMVGTSLRFFSEIPSKEWAELAKFVTPWTRCEPWQKLWLASDTDSNGEKTTLKRYSQIPEYVKQVIAIAV